MNLISRRAQDELFCIYQREIVILNQRDGSKPLVIYQQSTKRFQSHQKMVFWRGDEVYHLHGRKSLKDELLEHFNFSEETPTNSSFNQRRAQLLPEAFEFLFREFTSIASGEKLFRGYCLLACDGSDLCIAHNPQDETTYFQSMPLSLSFL